MARMECSDTRARVVKISTKHPPAFDAQIFVRYILIINSIIHPPHRLRLPVMLNVLCVSSYSMCAIKTCGHVAHVDDDNGAPIPKNVYT